MKIFVGISGASGSIYGGRLLKALMDGGHDVTACFSDGAVEVIRQEEQAAGLEMLTAPREMVLESFFDRHGLDPHGLAELVLPESMGSTFASGSALLEAAFVCPCSMSSVGSIAAGVTRNLIHRVADVMLKEGRPLVVVPRETPLSLVHLRNLLTLKEAGAGVVPAMPGFYHNPGTIEDLVDFVVSKALDVVGIGNDLFRRWEGS